MDMKEVLKADVGDSFMVELKYKGFNGDKVIMSSNEGSILFVSPQECSENISQHVADAYSDGVMK